MPDNSRIVTAGHLAAVERAAVQVPADETALLLSLPPQEVPDGASTPRAAAMVEAAKHRSTASRASISQAARRLADSGENVTVASVAREAGVSRQTVYQHRDLLGQIMTLRASGHGRRGPGLPAAQRASEDSLRARLQAQKAQIEDLRKQNASLRAELTAARAQVGVALGKDF